jgi:hypothetical protein
MSHVRLVLIFWREQNTRTRLFTKKWERDSQKNEVEAIKEVVALTGEE